MRPINCTKEELAENFEHMIEHYTQVALGQKRILRMDIFRPEKEDRAKKYMGSQLQHGVAFDIPFNEVAREHSETTDTWKTLGYIVRTGFVSPEEAAEEVEQYQRRLADLAVENS